MIEEEEVEVEELDNDSFEEIEVEDNTSMVLELFDPSKAFADLSNDDPNKYVFYQYYSEYSGKTEEDHKIEKWDEILEQSFEKIVKAPLTDFSELVQMFSLRGTSVIKILEVLKKKKQLITAE